MTFVHGILLFVLALCGAVLLDLGDVDPVKLLAVAVALLAGAVAFLASRRP